MKIDHIAIWAKDLEKMKDFYLRYFEVEANQKYHNPKKNFSSYFLSFSGGARIEIMHRPEVKELLELSEFDAGLTHFAISVGSKQKVDEMTEIFRNDGYTIVGEPRTTGDGFYESVIEDPENNRIELTE